MCGDLYNQWRGEWKNKKNCWYDQTEYKLNDMVNNYWIYHLIFKTQIAITKYIQQNQSKCVPLLP